MKDKNRVIIKTLTEKILFLESRREADSWEKEKLSNAITEQNRKTSEISAELANRQTEITALGELISRQDHIISELEKRIDPQELIVIRSLMTGDGS